MSTNLHWVEVVAVGEASIEVVLRPTGEMPCWVDRSFLAAALGLDSSAPPALEIDREVFDRACAKWRDLEPERAITRIDASRRSDGGVRYRVEGDDALFAPFAPGMRFGSTAYALDPDAPWVGDNGELVTPPAGVECNRVLRVDEIDGVHLTVTAFAGSSLPLALPAPWLRVARLLPSIDRDLPGMYDPWQRASKYFVELRPLEVHVGTYSGMLRSSGARVLCGEPDRAGSVSHARYSVVLTDPRWVEGISLGAPQPFTIGLREIAALRKPPPAPDGEADTFVEMVELAESNEDLIEIVRDGLHGGDATVEQALRIIAKRGAGLDAIIPDVVTALRMGAAVAEAIAAIGSDLARAWLTLLLSLEIGEEGIPEAAARALERCAELPDWASASLDAYRVRLERGGTSGPVREQGRRR